jgi:hypothetical protein
MARTESEERGLLKTDAEGSTRVEEAETDEARETTGFIWVVSSCSGRGLVEGTEAPEQPESVERIECESGGDFRHWVDRRW